MKNSNEKAVNSTEVVNTVATQVKQLGRPANPDSVRQKRIADLEARRASGSLKKGRPVIATSKRQALLAKRAEVIAANGSLKKGRPVVGTSKRQSTLAEREAKRAAGIEVKKGRPKVEKVTEVTVEPVAVELVTLNAETVTVDVPKVKGKKNK